VSDGDDMHIMWEILKLMAFLFVLWVVMNILLSLR